MTVKQLQNAIREKTAEANIRIAEYRERGKSIKVYEKEIGYLKQYAGTKTGARGEVGLGFKNKTKVQLEKQLNRLEGFIAKDVYSEKGKEAYNRDRYDKSRSTFKARYGYMSESDFRELYDTFDVLRNELKDYGYEDIGPSLAQQFQLTTNKAKFADYVLDVAKHNKGISSETFIDILSNRLKQEGAL